MDENNSSKHNIAKNSSLLSNGTFCNEKEIGVSSSIRKLSKSQPPSYAIAEYLSGWSRKKQLAFSTAGFYLLDDNIIYEEREDEFDEPIIGKNEITNLPLFKLDENIKPYLGLPSCSFNWPTVNELVLRTNSKIEFPLTMAQMSKIRLKRNTSIIK